MQGLWLEEQTLSFRADLPQPEAPTGEALVRVLRAGICNTDLELLRGYYPYRGIPGHEFVGEVTDGPEELLGRRVAGEINAVCGQCRFCRAGLSNHCERRTVLGIVNRNGAFGEYLTLPAANLHLVPDSVSAEAATFTEPLAAALQIQTQVNITPQTRVLVAGDGKLGQLIAQTLALTGCELWVVGRHPAKLARLADFGIATALVQESALGGFDVAVECTGNPEGLALALDCLRPRGTLVLKSTYAGRVSLNMAPIVVNEITLVGSRCGPFAPALRLLETGKIRTEDLVEAVYPLEAGLEAFAQAQKRGALKILLNMEG
ncbi:MAG: alcohol dehydrogenase catalytic domain-containing protein [Cyanobacteria bacterium RI_101]|nr:alcohol dehydrogenase catalytic domain-containing protein [Cyanobacteria bacterium RI_101]